MHRLFLVLLTISFLNCGGTDIYRQAAQLEKQGRLHQAQQLIHRHLAENQNLSRVEKSKLSFAAERLRRLPKDYTLNRERLLGQLAARIKDFKPDELEQWEKSGWLDAILVEGEKKYHYASRSNLFFRYPEIRTRRTTVADDARYERAILEYCQRVKRAGEETLDYYVLPQRFRVSMHLQVDAEAVPAGETVRCWLPYPRAYPFQTDIRVIKAEPPLLWIDQPQSASRSLYLEQKAEAGNAVDFRVQFEYTSFATSTEVDPDLVLILGPENEKVRQYTKEKIPHLVFSPELRQLAAEVVGTEQNPYLKARRIYDWISNNIVYSYMIEYSLIDNLSMYAYHHRYGDCGVMGLLFIALCRISGVPARWQGCWMFFPEEKTIHDWAEFYVEPYGWLPCDPYEGSWVVHEAQSLNDEEKKFLLDFYFGSMTSYRMAANADYVAELYPLKNDFRSDRIDFQRGEVEWGDQNIYFDQRSFNWQVEEVK